MEEVVLVVVLFEVKAPAKHEAVSEVKVGRRCKRLDPIVNHEEIWPQAVKVNKEALDVWIWNLKVGM